MSQNQICGTIRLGCSLNIAHYHLPPILKAYTDQYPQVDVQITTGQSKHLFQLFNRDEISIAIIRGQYAWDEACQLISTEPMCLVCSRETRTPADRLFHIGRHTDSDLSARINQWLAPTTWPRYAQYMGLTALMPARRWFPTALAGASCPRSACGILTAMWKISIWKMVPRSCETPMCSTNISTRNFRR